MLLGRGGKSWAWKRGGNGSASPAILGGFRGCRAGEAAKEQKDWGIGGVAAGFWGLLVAKVGKKQVVFFV